MLKTKIKCDQTFGQQFLLHHVNNKKMYAYFFFVVDDVGKLLSN